ncbi:MAG: molybdopterin-dependent oxidoreductase, partial [Acidobacteria bacterium]|nr:molybdopterin-dependent oxidoreductase [Acidobacteriota bacterium]
MEKYRTCTLCEAMCGLKIEVNNGIVQSIKGDEKDPFSRGHICPKALALKDLHEDPNRIRTPLLREGERWIPIPWNQAIEWVARKIVALQQRYDEDAFAIYAGNPNVHNLGSMLYLPTFTRLLKTRNRFSASSVDQWPHQQVAFHMYGHQFLVPIPDLDNLDLFVIMGGNPLASNGSMMTAPDLRTRLKTIRDRGHLVVIDPR